MNNYLLTLCALLLCGSLLGQSGVLRGKVTDELGLGLPGANIYIENLQKGTTTDVAGNFTVVGLEAGSYEVTISFIGYATRVQSAEIAGDQTTVLDLSLEPGVEFDQEILVLGDRLKGQAKALNQQKTNANITNIVAADQIGRFPDANIGDAVKRIPGITMQGDQGEARNIVVRGLAPQLNSVTINGDRVPSAEGDNRNVQMDLIPADMVQTIEVNKAVTPDMDGDAIGGSVNLVTRPAPSGFRLSATAASGLNLLTEKPIWTGSLILGNRFANDKLGVLVAASINDHDFGSDNVEAEWSNEAESPLTGDDIEVDPYVAETETRTYLVRRLRRSLSANLDYQISPNHTIALRGLYNWRDDWENRFRVTYDDIEPVFADGTETITGFEGVVGRETKGGIGNDRNDNRRLEDQRVQNYALTGDHLFGNMKVNWMASYAKASEERLNERYLTYELPDAIPFRTDFSDREFPFATALDPADVALDRFEFDELTEENQYTEEEDINARLDFQYPVSLGGQDGFLKFGGRYRDKTKFRDNNFFEFSPVSGLETLADVDTEDLTKSDFLAGEQYEAGSYASAGFLGSLDLFNPSLFEGEEVPDEYLPVNYNADETVLGGYVMWNQALSEKFSVLAGVRVEATSIDYTGNSLLDGEELIEEVSNSDDYVNVLPGIHLKYNLQPNTILRAAWTNTLARPNYYDLVPYRNVVAEDEEIFEGNPNLEPTTSMNFDLMAEHYFRSVGIVSAGAFYKQVAGFIYFLQSEDAATGFDKIQPQNGGNADLFGFEVAVQRQLDFLPGIWKGLGVYLNYTYLSSSADGIRNEDGDLRDDLDLPGAAPHMLNASLSFETKRLVLRASLNYSDAYIDEVGDSDFADRYYDRQLFLDVNGSFAITEQLRVFAEANNLTNQPLRYYQGVSERTMQMEYYNARFNLGLKYDLFKK